MIWTVYVSAALTFLVGVQLLATGRESLYLAGVWIFVSLSLITVANVLVSQRRRIRELERVVDELAEGDEPRDAKTTSSET
jgi:hypothetical protein